jgi:hypothetical protein
MIDINELKNIIVFEFKLIFLLIVMKLILDIFCNLYNVLLF